MSIDAVALWQQIQNVPALSALVWLLVCAALFGLLAEISPFDKAQPRLRKDSWLDGLYWLAGPVLYGSIASGLTMGGFFLIFGGDKAAMADFFTNGGFNAGAPIWTSLPFPLVLIALLLITDFSLYWTHRLFHSAALWRFHAIHHSAENLDWLHAVRFHPFNVVCHSLFANSLALWLGFPPAAILALVPFNTLYSAMVHANLNWDFGPLKTIFASPIYHRWHHTGPDEGGNKNFAATFPFLDILFGTYYFPKDKSPTKTGIEDNDLPPKLLAHLIYPFVGGKNTMAGDKG